MAQIEEEGEDINAKQSFIMGYSKYTQNDLEQAEVFLNQAVLNRQEDVRLHAAIFLTEILIQQEDYDRAVQMAGETLKSLSVQTYNEEYEAILRLMQQIIYLQNGKMKVIESLENILGDEQKIDAEIMCDYKNKLGVLYFYNGNYARGIERFLEVMAHTETMENKYYGAKAQIDLGTIYGALGNYDEAKANFKAALEMEIEDLEDMAFIKTYACINLYENMLHEENYEGIKQINEMVLAYVQYLPENLYDSITIMNDIFLCNYYINVGEIEQAEQMMEKITENLKMPEHYTYLSVHTNYELLKAGLASANGNIDDAINVYKQLLHQEDRQFEKYILRRLSEVLNENGYYTEANEYEEQLRAHYEEEAISVNMDYSSYALYKYEHQKSLIEEARMKLRKYIFMVLYTIIGIMLIGVCYFKYRQLAHINKLDGLTKIYNRRHFEECYKKLQNSYQPFAIMIFDIDHFKSINDTYGHLVGDKVIKQTAEIAKNIVGDAGKIFRYGGEEFVVILEEISENKAVGMAEQVRMAIEGYEWQQEMHVTVSIGVAQTDMNERNILDKADQKLYAAKNQGRNRVIY